MKKYIFMIIPLLLIGFLQGIQQELISTSINTANVQLTAAPDEISEEVISHTFALLADDAQIQINGMVLSTYGETGELLEQRSVIDDSRVRLTNQFTFREMRGFTVAVDMLREENGQISVIEELNYDIIGQGTRAIPETISEVFLPLYKALAGNFHTSYLVNLPFKQPAMLIFSHSQLETALNPFVRWKKAKGLDVTVVDITEVGTNPTNNMLRDYIVNYYQNAENKPEYLLLIGGGRTGAELPIPTFYAGDYNDATDLPFGLIEGDDYFPEIIVGRFSVSNSYQLATIVNKTIAYEKEPYMDETDWMTRATVIAGNYATTSPIPITPVLFSKWLVRLFFDSGYTEVDTIFWRPGDPLMTSDVIDAINRGSQYVNYRGWAAAMGWHYPLFHISDLLTTNTGRKSQIVTSWVCNTGDFVNSHHNPSFGEAWMRMGTPANPNGAVAFIGPSYLHTSTPFNNIISAGFHWGVQVEGIRCLGAALLRAKIELYNGFPNDHEPGGVVDFYFRVYNALSDPSLNLWRLIPHEMNIALPTQIDQGTNYIDFAAPNLTGGYVTITRDQENYTTHRIEDDYAFIPLDPEEQGDIIITVTAENHLPTIQTIEITSSDNITLLDYDFNEDFLIPGETVTLNATFKNYSDSGVADVNVTLNSNMDDHITITNDNVSLGDISAGGTATGSFEFQIAPECPHYTVIQFTLDISPTEDVAKIQTVVTGLLFDIDSITVNSANSFLDPGETATIDVSITNIGYADAHDLIAFIEPQTDAVQVISDHISFGNIAVGATATGSLEVSAYSDVAVGKQAYFLLNFEDQAGRETHVYFNITIGEVTNEHPTGPCSYGYYAYDSFDTSYPYAPVYEWVNIDPQNGGSGDDMWLHDDETVTMDMPFTFRYYGIDYDEISICSNGWITFIPTDEFNFRNWHLPSPIVPKGIIAPFWDDLKGLDDVDNEVRVAFYHDVANNRMIISWLDAYNIANLTPDGKEKIQVILEPRPDQDGDIIFQYHTLWDNNHSRNFSTVGIMDHTRTVGLEYVYAQNYPPSATPLQNGMAIRITTDPPDPYTYVEDNDLPVTGLTLSQNYPNPFNPETVIEFTLPSKTPTSLEIFNVRGQKVKTLVDGELELGRHRYIWNGTDNRGNSVGSGVYFYKLSTPDETRVQRMILLK